MNSNNPYAPADKKERVPLLAQYHKTPELSASSVFGLRPEELQLFFERDHLRMPDNLGEKRECLVILEKVGLTQGLLESIATDGKTGIIGDVKDIARRRKFFGENTHKLPKTRTAFEIFRSALLDDDLVRLLLIVATFSFIVSFFANETNGWVPGVSIYIAVLFMSTITTICNFGKESQFRNLYAQIQAENATVVRGQYGISTQVPFKEIVVGDIVLLKQGDRVPADCLLIQEMDMQVDQRNIFPEQQNYAVKQCSDGTNHLANPDPILLQGSLIMSGAGRAVVLAVGENTRHEMELTDSDLQAADSQKTAMTEKLEEFGDLLSKYAKFAAILILVILTVYQFMYILIGSTEFISGTSLFTLIDNIQITIALLIVCVPEGLPLAVSMSMAFSIDRLIDDNLLIKNLEALETSGSVLDILTGKTQTLSTGKLKVEQVFTGMTMFRTDKPDLNIHLQRGIMEAIILNSDVQLDIMDDEQQYVMNGSPVEVGLMDYLSNQNISVQQEIVKRERNYEMMTLIPFSSTRKCMTVAYFSKENQNVMVVTKGAPEYVVRMTTNQADSIYDTIEFDGAGRQGDNYLEKVISDQIARSGSKPLTFAYKTLSLGEFTQMKQDNFNFETEEGRAALESGLTLLVSFGFGDQLRPGVSDAIEKLYEGSTNTRIISGDHRDTVVAVARHFKIIEEDNTEGVYSGEVLRVQLFELMAELPDQEHPGKTRWQFKTKEARKEFQQKLKKDVQVVYRATPFDKLLLTAALRDSGSFCAVTGESISDVMALEEADVGFCMGSGCSVAKDHADIIFMDDNFSSIFNAVKWGRNIFENCRKFIMFQLTVNISCLFIVLVSCLTIGSSPFTVVQLLWINMVMDVLAAIALATEAPHPTKLRKDRIKKTDNFVIPVMWRQIFSQVLYQAIVMLVLLYLGPMMFGIEYKLVENEPFYVELSDGEIYPTYRLQHLSLLFQTFVLMNLFNMINCRKIGNKDDPCLNVFEGITGNWWFLIVLLCELNLQYFMVSVPQICLFFLTTPLTFSMHLTAFLLGVGSLLVALAVKKTPFEWTEKLPKIEERETENSLTRSLDMGLNQVSSLALSESLINK